MENNVIDILGNVSDDVKKQPGDLSLSGLLILARYHGIAVNPEDIRHQFSDNNDSLNSTQWLLAARFLGLKSKLVSKKIDRLHLVSLPAMVWREDGSHFILARIDNDKYLIQDIALGRPIVLDKDVFESRSSRADYYCIAPYQGVAVAANGKDLKHLYVQHLRSFGQIGYPKKNIEISSRSIYGVRLKLLFIKSFVSSSAF